MTTERKTTERPEIRPTSCMQETMYTENSVTTYYVADLVTIQTWGFCRIIRKTGVVKLCVTGYFSRFFQLATPKTAAPILTPETSIRMCILVPKRKFYEIL